jgi:hypothetical protein
MPEITRAEMISLVERLSTGKGSEAQQNAWLKQLSGVMPVGKITDLIYWPDREMTADEIVETIIAYKPRPIQALPDPNSPHETE